MSHYTTTHALRLLRFTHRPTKPPQWTPAPEPSHEFGLFNEAPERESEAAEAFCNSHPLGPPRLLSSSVVDGINTEGCKVWGLEQPESVRFAGRVDRIGSQVRVRTGSECGGVCLLGDLPLMAGLYDIQGMAGVYYEILIQQMDGIIAIG
jgi:hypothetical protein